MAAVDLVQGAATVLEIGAHYLNPFGAGLDLLLDSGVITDPTLKSYATALQTINPTGARFDDDPETVSATEEMHMAIDEWQNDVRSKVRIPKSYDEIDSLADAGEWAIVTFSGQVPQLALMVATGGQSVYLSTGILGATAGGQKYMSMEEQERLFHKTGGLYGQDFSFGQMLLSSATVGIAEGLSERITFGQVKGVSDLSLIHI